MSEGTRHQILVVDDDNHVCESLKLLFTAAGYDVSTAANGFEALLQLKLHLPAVITSDLNMPQMSGFEFLSVVRRRFPQIPVVAISGAFAHPYEVPGGVIADAFYAKGEHHPEVLLSTVAELIRTSADHARAHSNESAPVWIPRNGKDSKGVPYIVVTCTQCLRSFPLSVSHDQNSEVQETACLFCSSAVRYIVDFSLSVASPRREQMSEILEDSLADAASR